MLKPRRGVSDLRAAHRQRLSIAFRAIVTTVSNLEDILKSILRGLTSLPEEKMRLTHLCSRLAPLDPAEIAVLFDIFFTRAPSGEGTLRLKSILVDPDGLKDALGAEKYRLTYLASLDMGLKRVSRLLTDLPPKKTGIHGYDKEEEAKMEFISLGQRRAMAKGSIKDTLDRLLSDPDTMVIGYLLDNPRITEREVLKVASKRPNSPKILKLLATHRKWSKRYPVVKAVVNNPYTAPRLAVGLLDFMLTRDLKEISSDKTLHPQLRMGADELANDRLGSNPDKGRPPMAGGGDHKKTNDKTDDDTPELGPDLNPNHNGDED